MSEEIKKTITEDIKVRALNTDDLFTLIDISTDMDTNNLVDKITELQKTEKSKLRSLKNNKELTESELKEIQTKVSYKAALIIIQNLGKARNKIYKLFSDVSGIPANEIKTQSISKTINIMNKIINQEEFTDFFSQITNKSL